MGSLLQFGFRRGVILTEGLEIGGQGDSALGGDFLLRTSIEESELSVVFDRGVHDVESLGAGAVVGEVRTDATIAEEDRLLQDVIASHGGADAITAGDIAALPGRTDLLGVTAHATEGDVDRTALDG
jgi:hypothetical protein